MDGTVSRQLSATNENQKAFATELILLRLTTES
jgi:hypothetical protein